VAQDPRYQFMFSTRTIEDTMADLLKTLFRIPTAGKPLTIVEMAGFPAEVVDAVVSVLCRLAFDLGMWGNGRVPLLVVCEEAHRYVPADKRLGFGPTRRSISRIAKEGRKYGVYLGVITQRPVELDPTILSQCSTIFAMRLANEQDHAIIRSAVSDAASSVLESLPSMGNREALAFGEAVSMPMRVRFTSIQSQDLPN
jgi:DNA helicase HerA-like ATPase